jgi:hypothetical protein
MRRRRCAAEATRMDRTQEACWTGSRRTRPAPSGRTRQTCRLARCRAQLRSNRRGCDGTGPKRRDAEETEGSGGSRDCAMTPTDGRWRARSVDESTLPEHEARLSAQTTEAERRGEADETGDGVRRKPHGWTERRKRAGLVREEHGQRRAGEHGKPVVWQDAGLSCEATGEGATAQGRSEETLRKRKEAA